jgi:hypothetical protein
MRVARVAVRLCALGLLAAHALSPALAPAQDARPDFQGTYQGVGTATSSDGEEVSAPVTIWVEDLGDTVRITGRAEGIVASAEGPSRVSGDRVLVSIAVEQPGISGSGEVTIELLDGTWVLDASGSGEAFGYSGSGSASATRVSPGVEVPGLAEQVADMFAAMLGGPSPTEPADAAPDDSTESAADDDPLAPGETGDGDAAASDVPAEPSPVAPATPQPPVRSDDALIAAGLAALLLILEIMLA